VLVPVSIGMMIKNKSEVFSERMNKPVKILSVIFLVLIIVAAVVKEQDKVVMYFQQVGLAALSFNILSMMVGYFTPLLFKLSKKEAISIGMEIGIHNGTLAIAIASSPLLLNNSIMAIPPAIYSLIMFFTAGAFGWWVSRKVEA
jgi:bile acid:Na+ symporter, BASS family